MEFGAVSGVENHPSTSETATNKIKLQIQLAEYEDAPHFVSRIFSEEKALLKLRDWLAALQSQPEDMVISINSCRFLFSG